jgi:hypothetical protein
MATITVDGGDLIVDGEGLDTLWSGGRSVTSSALDRTREGPQKTSWRVLSGA